MNRPARLKSSVKADDVTYVLVYPAPLRSGNAGYEYLWSNLYEGGHISGRVPERDVTEHRGVP